MVGTADISAILLAAGRSTRFGDRDKLLEPLDGRPIALHAAQRIAEMKLARKIAVCRTDGGTLPGTLRALGFEVVLNDDPDAGLSRSLALGIGSVAGHDTAAAMCCLADMPFISRAHLEALIAAFDADTVPIVASSLGGIASPPALFGRALYPHLIGISGDQGARGLLRGARLVETDPHELADIDRPEDLPERP